MVQSITLNVEDKCDLRMFIVAEFGEIVEYNSIKGNESIEDGYTFKDQSIITKMIDDIFPAEKLNERLDTTCKCDFCTEMQTSGNLIRMMFGFCIDGNAIRRNIWLATWMQFIYYERIQLLYHFLLQVQERLKNHGINSVIDLSDIDDRALNDYKYLKLKEMEKPVEKWTNEKAGTFLKDICLKLDHYHGYIFYFKGEKDGYLIEGRIGGYPDDIRGETIHVDELATRMGELRILDKNGHEVYLDIDTYERSKW